ncbi:hypothetical protein [Nostoc sphaeroides]|nr:hypothetical protein [Nostoc sphaeroides]
MQNKLLSRDFLTGCPFIEEVLKKCDRIKDTLKILPVGKRLV